MANGEIQKLREFADMQMAAEAFLSQIVDLIPNRPPQNLVRLRLEEGNRHASRFVPIQAETFASQYDVVAQYRNDPLLQGQSGFSGTLFRNRVSGELTLSFRSTEFIEDAVRDTVSTADQEIRQLGWAFGQIAEMEAWYAELRADPSLLGGKSFNVTGYSLGGHLATAFNILRREESTETPVISTYTFNGAGVGDIRNGRRLTDILADFNRLRSSPDITATADWLALSVDERELISSQAASRVAAINSEAARLTTLQPRETFQLGLPPAGVQATLQYQIAALMAARDTIASSNFPLPGGVNYFPSTPVFAALPIGNMVEVVGMETDGLGMSFVSNSGIHYGSRQEVAIEAQPRVRGSFSLADLLQGNLLVNNPDKNNFGDSHSLVLLIDSLSAMAAMERLAPDLTIETAGRIFAAASNVAASTQLSSQGKAEGDTLERIVDSLYKLLVGSAPETYLDYKGPLAGNTWSRDEFRQPLYARLQEVNSKTIELIPATGLSSIQMAALDSLSADGLLEGANEAGTDGLAYRYALRELNPFVVLDPGNVGLYARYMAGGANAGELDDYDASTARQGISQQYLEDRAAFLERKLFLTASNLDKNYQDPSNPNSNPEPGTRAYIYQSQAQHFGDRTSGFIASTGGPNPDSLQHFIFGSDDTDVISGPTSGREDNLYGGAGADTLTGNVADDYLEGGVGLDTYQFRSGDGADTVLDSDGKGILVRNGKTLAMGLKVSADVWQLGGTTYERNGTNLEVTFSDNANDRITIRDFDFAKATHDGYLGTRLINEPPAPTTTLDILGDRELKNYTVDVPADPGGEFPEDFVYLPEWLDAIQSVKDRIAVGINPDTGEPMYEVTTYTVTYHLNDARGNRERTDVEDLDATDILFDSELDDRIFTGGNDDRVNGTRGGNDRIEAGSGRDWVRAGEGADWVEGGANGDSHNGGGDLLEGGAGNDTLFGETAKPIAQAIADGELGGTTTDRGEYINAGAGDDIAVGGDKTDVLFGAGGADLLVGGAGDDFLNGDLDFLLQEASIFDQPFQWQVQFTIGGTTRRDIYPGFAGSEAPDPGADLLYGGAGNDAAYGGGGNDYIELGAGEDWGLGEGGDDTLIGGAGKDILEGDRETLAISQHGDDYLDGGADDDFLFGNGGADVLIGGQGDDQLQGGAGDDVLHGGTETDVLLGGVGKDTYVYYRGDGVDVVIDPDITTDSQHRSALVLGPGIDRASVKFRLGSMMIDLGEGDAIHLEGFDADDPLSTPVLDSIHFADGDFMTYQDMLDQGFDLDGTEGNDYIKGTAVTDRIDAKGGNDIIEAGAGNDTVVTGAGADIVFGNAGDDWVVAGDGDLIIDLEGTNTLDLMAYAGLTQANLEITQYGAPDGDTYLNFHVRDDMNPGLTPATGGVSVQYGEIGNFASVTVSDGAEGTVELSYDELMTQYAGHGLVYSGQAAAETLIGTQFADTFFGQAGADTIRAGAGDDKMDGGAGDDTLEGGAGNDTYLLGYNRGRDSVIEDGAAAPNATHTILLDAGIPSSLVYARQSGNDLEVRLRATGDALVLKDFYLQPQSWQDGWQVRDRNGALTDLADYVPVIPPQAATWLEEEEQAYRVRREQVFAANQQADGFLPLGDNVFQHTEQVFNYAGASVNGSTTTVSLVAETQSSDAGQISASTQFTSTPIGVTNVVVDLGLPIVQGTGGEKSQVTAEIGTGGASNGASFQFFSIAPGGGGSFKLNPGDYAVPVYGPTFGNAQGLSSAGSLDYASAGNFNNSSQWRLIGYNVIRAGSGGSSAESVAAIASYQNYDQHLTVQDVEAGGAANTVTASSSVVNGGAGNDTITLGAGNFFAGPDWEGTFDLAAAVDPESPSGAQGRYLSRLPGLLAYPLLYPARANLLGGFANGGDGDDTISGSVGQDVIVGGNGADVVDGGSGSDRILVGLTDSGIDTIADGGLDSYSYLDYYYWSRGILNWDERALHANEWRMDADGGDNAYFATEEEALASQSYGAPVFIAPLPEAAPVLTRDDPLYDQLVAAGVLAKDVLEFGPGLTLQDLDISVQVDTFSAQDNPDRPWINGGRVSVRWGADSGVDFDAPALNSSYEAATLLEGGWIRVDASPVDGSWNGYRLGQGIEAFGFADGSTLTVDQLLAGATVNVNESQNYVFRRDSGYQLVDRRHSAIDMADGIASAEVFVKRDGLDLLVSVPGGYPEIGAQGRIRNWYTNPQAMPQTDLMFEFEPAQDAAALTARGLEVHGTFAADSLVGLNGFADRLLGEGGDDAMYGVSGDDALAGGAGRDYLDGGVGKDTYLFNVGDGADTIADAPSGQGDPDASVIAFGEGIFSWQVYLGLGSLVLHYGEGDSIRFTAFDADDPYSTPVFERLEFADGSSRLYEEILANGFYLNGTEGEDVINGTSLQDQINGSGGNDTLYGRGGHDSLNGGAGNDVLSGNEDQDDLYGGDGDDTLAGGLGDNDSLAGEEGSDTYVYTVGDGRDDVFEWDDTPGEEDRVQLPGFGVADLRVTRDLWSYYLVMADGDRLSLNGMPIDPAAVVERIEFEDGTVWTPTDVDSRVELLPGTEGFDVLWGTSGIDVISGVGGEDDLYGNAGDDLLAGGEGGDYYHFAAGDGHDTIDNLDADGSFDSIDFADAASTEAVLSRDGTSLVITLGTDSVALADWYSGANRKIDSIYFDADGGYWDAATIELLAPLGGNSAPEVANPLPDLSFEAGESFAFHVPSDTFFDADAGDELALSANMFDGGLLPAWLSFDPAAGIFTGNPATTDIGVSYILVTAVDASGGSAVSDFGLVVRVPAGAEATGSAGDDVIYGGTGNETLTAKGGSDYLFGDVGNDLLKGGGGNDVLQGGAGSDVLRGGKGQNVLDGGAGDDLIFGGAGSAFIAGGSGNDILRVGSGNDVIVFNAGDGMDTIYGGRDGGNTLSFGGGIRYSDISLSKSGKDLVVSTGTGEDEGVTLKNWYGGNHSVLSLQVMLDATEEFDAGSTDPLYNRRVQTLDFLGMVSAFDAARAATPALTSWEFTNAVLAFHLSGVDDAALGGDLAYWYSKNRTLQGISLQSAQQVIGVEGFGSEAQSLRPFSGLQEGLTKLA